MSRGVLGEAPGSSLGSKTGKREKTAVPGTPLGPKGETKLAKNRQDGVPEGVLRDKSHHSDCFLGVLV